MYTEENVFKWKKQFKMVQYVAICCNVNKLVHTSGERKRKKNKTKKETESESERSPVRCRCRVVDADREAFSSVLGVRVPRGELRRCDWVSAGWVENHSRAIRGEECGNPHARRRFSIHITPRRELRHSAALTCWMGDRGYTEWGSWWADEFMECGARVTENVKWHQVETHTQNGLVRAPGVIGVGE